MCSSVEDTVRSARDLVRQLDDGTLPAKRALHLVDLFSELEKLAVAGRTVAAARVVETRVWRATGATSAAAWLADRAGSTLTQAAATLHAGAGLDALPATKDALLSGELSEAQTTEIAAAALADPSAESSLLCLARSEPLSVLRERARDVRAAAAGDEEATERIRRSRYFRHWTERDGAVRLEARLAPADAAPLIAEVGARAERLRRRSSEPLQAHAADALVSLVSGPAAPRSIVNVHVSAAALERGKTVAGETCRIEGIGPISVADAKRLAVAGDVRVIEMDGADVGRVSHAGRTIPTRLRTALEARDTTCAVPACSRRQGLEIDHVIPLSEGGRTSLDNLARLCRWHHAQKTHHGWRLTGEPGARRWERKPHAERRRAPADPAGARVDAFRARAGPSP